MDRIEVSIEGPYGPPSTQFLRCLHTFKAVPIFGLNMFYLKDSFHMVFKAVKIRLSTIAKIFSLEDSKHTIMCYVFFQ